MITLSPEGNAVAVPPPALSLRLFGPFTVAVHGQPVPKVRSQKERWLLALLALRAPAPLERAWLAETLWPETPHEDALYNLRRNLRLLRTALGPEAGRLQSPTPRTLTLDLAGADCDAAAFDAAVRRGDPASQAEAAALYAGPLLLGCPEEWALPEREARERAVLDALEALAAGAGDPADAAARLRRALEIDPLRETALRALLETLAAQGCHAAATEAYRAFRRRVRDEMNTEPDSETVAAYRRIQADARRPAPVESSAPACRGGEVAGHLPTPLTTLIGREGEITAVAAALDRSRLVTLTGPGGVGKTRLALAAAGSLRDEFEDGTWFADLAPLADPKLLTAALITALGLREEPGRTPTEALVESLRGRRLLLVLDNCEHLAVPCAHLALGLLRECPALRILATSREPLRVPGEAVLAVPGLPPTEASRLFAERAAQSSPSFRLTPAGEEAVADICRRLDGIPLAIEMAAARARSLPVSQIAARLGDAFRLLSEPGGDLLPRHQTLRAVLDWSHDLLPAGEKALLARLSVFAGGWTLEAAEAVCADPAGEQKSGHITPDDVLDLLTSLVDKSLAVFEEQPDGTGRYRLLETVRQYGRERLRGVGEEDAKHRRHADHFLALAEQAEAHMAGPEQAYWMARLEAEHDNLRGALLWCRIRAGADPEIAALEMRLAGALTHFWWIHGHQQEGRLTLNAVLEQPGLDVPSPVRLKGLKGAAVLAKAQGGYEEARRLYEQALGLARQLGDTENEGGLLGGLAGVVGNMGKHAAAHALLEEALALNRKTGNRHQMAYNLASLGYLARLQGDVTEAGALLTEAVTISREVGDRLGVASHLGSLAAIHSKQGDLTQARCLLEETLVLYRTLGNRSGVAWTLASLADLALDQGDLATARMLLEEALDINRRLGNRAGEAWNLQARGYLLVRLREYARAEASLQQALVAWEGVGDPPGVAWCRHGLGVVSCAQGDYKAASGFAGAALRGMRSLGMKGGMMDVMESVANLLRLTGRPEAAAGLLGAVETERQSLGLPRPASWRDWADEIFGGLRQALGEDAFDAAWNAGLGMGWERAVDYALSEEE